MKLGAAASVGSTIGLAACEKFFEYSPYQENFDDRLDRINEKNIEEIMQIDLQGESSFKIALVADNHKYTDQFVSSIDRIRDLKEIKFVVHLGDFADFGLLKEYRWYEDIMNHLKVPYCTTIGNHDCLGNGFDIYKDTFGSPDYSFVFNNIKFIFFNNVIFELGDREPRFEWLEAELAEGQVYDQTLMFSHIPPYTDQFNERRERIFSELLSKYNIKNSFHGHQHNPENGEFYNDGVNYTVVPWSKLKKYMILDVSPTGVSMETISF